MANSGTLESVHTHQGSEIPSRVINLDEARARHGDKADYMARMLAAGDPLADAVIVEMDTLGKEARWAVARSSRILCNRPSRVAACRDTIHRTQPWVGRGRVGRSDQPGGCGPHMAGLHSDALPGSGRTRHRTDGSRAKQPLQVLALHCLSAGTGGHLLRGRQ